MLVRDVIKQLQKFDASAQVLIESSDGEYGPRPINSILAHQGKTEHYGVDWVSNDEHEALKGVPVIRY